MTTSQAALSQNWLRWIRPKRIWVFVCPVILASFAITANSLFPSSRQVRVLVRLPDFQLLRSATQKTDNDSKLLNANDKLNGENEYQLDKEVMALVRSRYAYDPKTRSAYKLEIPRTIGMLELTIKYRDPKFAEAQIKDILTYIQNVYEPVIQSARNEAKSQARPLEAQVAGAAKDLERTTQALDIWPYSAPLIVQRSALIRQIAELKWRLADIQALLLPINTQNLQVISSIDENPSMLKRHGMVLGAGIAGLAIGLLIAILLQLKDEQRRSRRPGPRAASLRPLAVAASRNVSLPATTSSRAVASRRITRAV